jgi:hypothetical protein
LRNVSPTLRFSPSELETVRPIATLFAPPVPTPTWLSPPPDAISLCPIVDEDGGEVELRLGVGAGGVGVDFEFELDGDEFEWEGRSG